MYKLVPEDWEVYGSRKWRSDVDFQDSFRLVLQRGRGNKTKQYFLDGFSPPRRNNYYATFFCG